MSFYSLGFCCSCCVAVVPHHATWWQCFRAVLNPATWLWAGPRFFPAQTTVGEQAENRFAVRVWERMSLQYYGNEKERSVTCPRAFSACFIHKADICCHLNKGISNRESCLGGDCHLLPSSFFDFLNPPLGPDFIHKNHQAKRKKGSPWSIVCVLDRIVMA